MKRDKIELECSPKDQQWRWRFVASNGRIMADGSEGYRNKNDALTAVMKVCGFNEYAITSTAEAFGSGRQVDQGYVSRGDHNLDLTVFW